MVDHYGRTLECELKAFKSIKLVNKSAPLQDVIQQIVEHVAPVARKQYVFLYFIFLLLLHSLGMDITKF